MAVALVDSNVLIDFWDERSVRHDRAREIVHAIDRGELPTGRVTNYIVLETLNWIHERRRHDLAIDTYRRLDESAGFEIHQAAQKDFVHAVELFETYDGIAFGDATIAAYMQREGIEYLYSFDDDFDALEWISRVDGPANPFR